MDSSRGNSGIYNGVSILFLTLTAVVIVVVVVMLLGPAPQEEQRSLDDLPAIVQLPSVTPSETPRPTLPPTFTHTPTTTPSPTNTIPPSATLTPSPTITDTPGPTLTASDTPTASISPTPEVQATATPVGPTPIPTATEYPFYFDLRGEVYYGPNSVNSAGCAWEGVGGSILDANGLEIQGRQFQVRVFGTGIERTTLTGSNSLYGQFTGWEVPLNNTVTQNTYLVRLETSVGTQISRDVPITFRGDCNFNSAIVTFVQVRPFGPPG